MSLQKSPGLEDFQDIIPEKTGELTNAQKVARILIGFFAIAIVILSIVFFWKSDLAAPLRGTGSVRGLAQDESGKPLDGSIYVTGTTLAAKTNPDGSFELKNIPAGKQLIVVANAGSGREYPVEITAGQASDLGTITIQSTATP
jgi:hypothetical protein